VADQPARVVFDVIKTSIFTGEVSGELTRKSSNTCKFLLLKCQQFLVRFGLYCVWFLGFVVVVVVVVVKAARRNVGRPLCFARVLSFFIDTAGYI